IQVLVEKPALDQSQRPQIMFCDDVEDVRVRRLQVWISSREFRIRCGIVNKKRSEVAEVGPRDPHTISCSQKRVRPEPILGLNTGKGIHVAVGGGLRDRGWHKISRRIEIELVRTQRVIGGFDSYARLQPQS